MYNVSLKSFLNYIIIFISENWEFCRNVEEEGTQIVDEPQYYKDQRPFPTKLDINYSFASGNKSTWDKHDKGVEKNIGRTKAKQ